MSMHEMRTVYHVYNSLQFEGAGTNPYEEKSKDPYQGKRDHLYFIKENKKSGGHHMSGDEGDESSEDDVEKRL